MGRTMSSDHVPFPMPERKHSLSQEWRYLSFLHWEVNPEKLEPYMPPGVEIDLYEGKAYVGTIPFLMKNVRPRLFPALPGISNFPEFNVRTYVKMNGKAGIVFLTLDAHSRITCSYAPRAYGLPYVYAKCKLDISEDNYQWSSKRVSDGVQLRGSCKAIGEQIQAKPGSLEEFLFERYSLYVEHKGRTKMAYTLHDPWTFRTAEATVEINTLTELFKLGIENPLKPDLVHMSSGGHVHTWSIEKTE